MKWVVGFLALWAWAVPSWASPNEIPVIVIADSINPGSSDYIISAIQRASDAKAPYLLIQMDTPGGLLQSTRQIVQAMLNAKIPIVVFVGPKGAHAGSAGALITFAADVAAMAPGTNIGAAHPVIPGEKMDKIMEEKLANDTAAFSESLAKSKGRNAEWAIKAVRQSASIIAEEALKVGVVDVIADDVPDLIKKLSGFRLKVAKQGVDRLPVNNTPPVVRDEPMSIKQRLVAFLSDPNLAYLIMSLGGLCIWIELSHPGLIAPGIIGVICLIVSMISFQMMPIHYGALALIFVGMGLLIAELFLPTFGIVGIGGIVCFVFGSLFLMDTGVPEYQISMKLIFPTAAVLVLFALGLGYIVMRGRGQKRRSGLEALVGEFGEVREEVTEKRGGKVFIQGELWSATTAEAGQIPSGTVVVVKEVRQMALVVEASAK